MTNKKIIDSWLEAKPMRGRDPDVWRKDRCDNKIRFGSYGTQGEYGWQIDHEKPKSKGGSSKDGNLQPLYWKENLKKSDKYPYKK